MTISALADVIPCTAHIQGVSRLEDITAAGDFLGLSDKKKFI